MWTRDLLILMFIGTVTTLLGKGLYASLRSGVLKTVRAPRAVRRTDEPVQYWFGMSLVTFAFVVTTAATVAMGWVLVRDLF